MKIVGGLCTHNTGDEVTTVFDKRILFCTAVVLIPAALAAAGCTRAASATGSPRPPEVQVVLVEQRDLPVYREWIGTLDGMVNAAIRAEVTGYLPSHRRRSNKTMSNKEGNSWLAAARLNRSTHYQPAEEN
jgi:hypothetical protein